MKNTFKFLLVILITLFTTIGTYAGANEDLTAACKQGDLAKVTAAINAGADVNALIDGNPAIVSAFFWPDITKLLLEKGADPNLGDYPALLQASSNYSTEVLKLLLDAGADPNKPGKSDPSVTFKTLIAAEKAKGKNANDALIKAWTTAMATLKPTEVYVLPILVMGTNCVPCLEMLLNKGADVTKGMTEGTLIHQFANYGHSREERKAGFKGGKANV